MRCKRQWYVSFLGWGSEKSFSTNFSSPAKETEQTTCSIQTAQLWDGKAAAGLCPWVTAPIDNPCQLWNVSEKLSSLATAIWGLLVPAAQCSNTAYPKWYDRLLWTPFLTLLGPFGWPSTYRWLQWLLDLFLTTTTDLSSPQIHFQWSALFPSVASRAA